MNPCVNIKANCLLIDTHMICDGSIIVLYFLIRVEPSNCSVLLWFKSTWLNYGDSNVWCLDLEDEFLVGGMYQHADIFPHTCQIIPLRNDMLDYSCECAEKNGDANVCLLFYVDMTIKLCILNVTLTEVASLHKLQACPPPAESSVLLPYSHFLTVLYNCIPPWGSAPPYQTGTDIRVDQHYLPLLQISIGMEEIWV